MRPESPFYRFNTDCECIVNICGIVSNPLEGTEGRVLMPEPGDVTAVFYEQGRLKAWPDVISADATHYYIKLFSVGVAQMIRDRRFTGIEFYPVTMKMGALKGLKDKVDACPGYVWGRVSGIVMVDVCHDHTKLPTSANGRMLLEKPPIGKVWKMRIQEEQLEAADFSRAVPGGTVHPVISKSVAEFFDSLSLKEVRIAAVGNGWL